MSEDLLKEYAARSTRRDPDRTLNIRHRAVRAFDFVLDATVAYFAANSADITAAIAHSTAEAQAGRGTVHLDEEGTLPVEADTCGYLIPAQQYDGQLAELLRRHQIDAQVRPDGVGVSMAQAHRRMIPLLLDARAETAIADAQRRSYCASGDPRLAPTRELLAELLDAERLAQQTASQVTSRLAVIENLLSKDGPVHAAKPVLTALIRQVENAKRDGSEPAARTAPPPFLKPPPPPSRAPPPRPAGPARPCGAGRDRHCC